MENAKPQSLGKTSMVQLILRKPQRLFAGIWLLLGMALVVAFWLPNYHVAMREMNGIDIVGLLFKETTHLRKMLEESSYLLMVGVPLGYVLLGMLALTGGVLQWQGNGRNWDVLIVAAALVVLIFTMIGLFVIGGNVSDAPFWGKLMPRPIYGYHLALAAEGLLLAAGITQLVLGRDRFISRSEATTKSSQTA